MTVPGVGPITALCYLATIDDPTRFKKSRSVGAYVGLTTRRYASGEIDRTGRISKCGDAMLRSYLYEAANVLLTRVAKWSALKAWGMRIAKRSEPEQGQEWPSLENLPSFCTGCGSTAPSSTGHRRRLPCSPLSQTTSSRRTGEETTSLPGRGDGEIVPGFAMPARAKRASHIDPPTSPAPSCGGHAPTAERTVDPARMFTESLTPDPELENSQGQKFARGARARSVCKAPDRCYGGCGEEIASVGRLLTERWHPSALMLTDRWSHRCASRSSASR